MDTRSLGGSMGPADSATYTDLNRLAQLKVGGDNKANIKKAAQEFEAMFINEMLKSMRSANEVFSKDNPFESNDTKTFQEMHDQQLSVTLARGKGVGLADVLMRQLAPQKTPRANPFAKVNGGETAHWPTAAKAAPAQAQASTAARDDSGLLNQRRLALTPKLVDRLSAGLQPDAAQPASNEPLAAQDWLAAQSYPAPPERPLHSDNDKSAALAELRPGKKIFNSRQDFIDTLLPMAEEAARTIGVDARYLVAQAALETGWGRSMIMRGDGSSSHNLFGIKSHGWQGESAKVTTTEYHEGRPVQEAASFRVYNSFAQSFKDYVSFLKTNGRYQDALAAADKPDEYVRKLQQAGYATDPQYARKISQIARQLDVYQMVASADTGLTRS